MRENTVQKNSGVLRSEDLANSVFDATKKISREKRSSEPVSYYLSIVIINKSVASTNLSSLAQNYLLGLLITK